MLKAKAEKCQNLALPQQGDSNVLHAEFLLRSDDFLICFFWKINDTVRMLSKMLNSCQVLETPKCQLKSDSTFSLLV